MGVVGPTYMLAMRSRPWFGGILAVRIAAFALGAAVSTNNSAAQPGAIFRCTNLASGANWQIRIDYEKSTVDSNPARISSTTISWHDRTAGGNYTLDRKSGNLTVIVASSTGGYFIYDRCKPEN